MIPMRVAVVGGGIVGLATAFRLQQRIPGVQVTILEKERAVDPSRASQDPTERPEVRMAPIAKAILEQDLSGEFVLSDEGITVPLVFRISTADVDAR